MKDYIKITPDVDINFYDLMLPVDVTKEFTLRDILKAVVNSSYIPIVVMQELLHCDHLQDYYDESESKPFEPSKNFKEQLEYLELYWLGDICKDKEAPDGINFSSQWAFHGVGKLGVVEDENNRPIDPELKETYRESYGIELSSLYTLTDYKIKIRKEIMIIDWRPKDFKDQLKKIEFQPSITLIELLYWIFWEISFFGSPIKRDEQSNELKRRIDEIEEAKKNGTIDQLLIPWEKVKADLENKYGPLNPEEENSETSTENSEKTS